MKVIVKARHMDLTDSMRSYAEEKLGDALTKIFDRPAAKIEIELSDLGKVHDGTKECRCIVHMPGGPSITVHETHDDMYTAINMAHDRLMEQVKRARGKRNDNHRHQLEAEKRRQETARKTLSHTPEPWEKEVKEFESTGQA